MLILILGIILIFGLLVFALMKVASPKNEEERRKADEEQIKFIREYNNNKGK